MLFSMKVYMSVSKKKHFDVEIIIKQIKFSVLFFRWKKTNAMEEAEDSFNASLWIINILSIFLGKHFLILGTYNK